MPYLYLAINLLLCLFPFHRVDAQNLSAMQDDNLETITINNAASLRELVVIDESDAQVIQIAFNSASSILAYTTNQSLNLWEVTTQTERWRIPMEGNTSIAFSPDSKLLAARVDYNLSLWDVETGEQKVTLTTATQERTGYVNDVTFVENRNELVGVVARSGGLVRWNADSGEFISEYNYGFNEFVRADYSILSPDGTLNVLARITYSIEFRNTVQGDIRNRVQIDDLLNLNLEESSARIIPLSISNDNQTLLISVIFPSRSQPNRIVWLRPNGEIIHNIELANGSAMTGAFNPNGDIIALGDRQNGEIYLLETSIGEEITVLKGHTDWITDLAFSPDGTLLASGGTDGTVRLWSVP